ncbi:MAG TPA: hypothetical protein VL443_14050 [Cyclobacteriaceae bacterium]|jgi:hypothetical protein|nr:hypothetical protein [Cyclobacteriaceae bacterium]
MKLGFNIQINDRSAIFNGMKESLPNHSMILCESMRKVLAGIGKNFQLPTGTTPKQLNEKFLEMESYFTRRGISNGQEIFLKFVVETWLSVNALDNYSINDKELLLRVLKFPIDSSTIILLNPLGSWVIQWRVRLIHAHASEETEILKIHLTSNANIVVVPDYVAQYLHTAIFSYHNGLQAVALALCSIALEATLKDRLKQRGYTFDFIERKKTNYIGGLGTAIDRARNREAFLTPANLVTDMDIVITTIRNNLVHLSEEAFNTPLPEFNSLSTSGNYLLKDFINSPMMVFDLIRSVTLCVDAMYKELRDEQQAILLATP